MFAIGYNVTYICIDTYGVLYEIYQNRGNPDFKINSTRADNVVTIQFDLFCYTDAKVNIAPNRKLNN